MAQVQTWTLALRSANAVVASSSFVEIAIYQPDVAAGEQGVILEQARMLPSDHVEQIVAGQRLGQLGIVGQQVPFEALTDV